MNLKDVDGLMPIRSGRLHAALSSLAMRIEMLEDALGNCAEEWNNMYHNGRKTKWPDGECGEDYDEQDEEWAFEALASVLCEDIKEDFGFDWKVTTRGRTGATILPTASVERGVGYVGYGRPVFSDKSGFRRDDYPHSIEPDDIWRGVTVEDGLTCMTDEDLVFLLEDLERVWKLSGGGDLPAQYYAAALAVFNEQDWDVKGEGGQTTTRIEATFLGELDSQSEIELTNNLLDSAVKYADLVIEATVELDILTAAFRRWNEFCRWAADGGFAEEVNYMVESRKEDAAEEEGETQ